MKKVRDTRVSVDHWSDYIASMEDSIRKLEENIPKAGVKRSDQVRVFGTLLDWRTMFLIGQYSSGGQTADMKQTYLNLVKDMERYAHVREGKSSFGDFDTYIHALWVVSWGVLLDVPRDIFEKVVDLLDNSGQDAIFDRIVSMRMSGFGIAPTVIYRQPYQELNDYLSSDGEERDRHIQRFLKEYYRGMKRAYWYDMHVQNPENYFGYWCFELAALVKGLGIKDEGFSQNPYYPRELVLGE